MTLLSVTRKGTRVNGLSTVGKRHISFSLNALQIHSYYHLGASADKDPKKNNSLHNPSIKTWDGNNRSPLSVSTSLSSRLFNSFSNDNTHVNEEKKQTQQSQSLPETHPYLSEIKTALSAIRKACRITSYLQPTTVDKNISGINKKDASPVTIGDFAVQALVLNLLDKELDNNNIFIAEEASKNLITTTQNDSDNGETINLSNEILDVMGKCGFDGIIGSVEELKRSIDLGQTYKENGTIMRSLLQEKNIMDDSTSFRTWCLDPIDGTRGFLRGKKEGGQYCVALALIEDGNPVVGILGCPNLPVSSTDTNYAWSDDETITNNIKSRGCIIVASKGGGCYQLPLNPPEMENDESTFGCKRIYVTQNDGQGEVPLSKARFCIGVEKYSDPDGKISSIARAIHGDLDVDGDIKYAARMDSQVKYGVLARGGAEFYARLPKKTYVEWIWDHAPGRIVIEEAGGLQTDTNGNVINYGTGAKLNENVNGVLASPGGIFHPALLKNLK